MLIEHREKLDRMGIALRRVLASLWCLDIFAAEPMLNQRLTRDRRAAVIGKCLNSRDETEPVPPWVARQRQPLTCEFYHSAPQLIVLELELVLVIVTPASTVMPTNREPNNVPLLQAPNSQPSRPRTSSRMIFQILAPQASGTTK